MDFDQLHTFLTVARFNSFSRAAEKCFRTQPAISSQIRSLEDEIGAKLFDRSGGKVALTLAGKAFQKYAEETVASQREIFNKIKELERVPTGDIIVAANEATCLHLLPQVFADFKRTHSKVGVNVMRAEHAKILEAVIDNSADFGVLSMPVSDPRLTVVVIHRDNLVVISRPRHPLTRLMQVSPEELAKYPLLLPKSGRTRDILDNLFHSRHVKPNIAMELDSSELLKRFVAANVGVGLVARFNVTEDVRAGVLRIMELDAPPIRRDLALVFRKDKPLSRAALAFIEIAVKDRHLLAAVQVAGRK